jgi:hypothetical protein
MASNDILNNDKYKIVCEISLWDDYAQCMDKKFIHLDDLSKLGKDDLDNAYIWTEITLWNHKDDDSLMSIIQHLEWLLVQEIKEGISFNHNIRLSTINCLGKDFESLYQRWNNFMQLLYGFTKTCSINGDPIVGYV